MTSKELKIQARALAAGVGSSESSVSNDYEAFCCEHKHGCKWQGFALHWGIGWGRIPDPKTNVWRQWHDKQCGGRLIPLSPPSDV